jgi:hypothetical protein
MAKYAAFAVLGLIAALGVFGTLMYLPGAPNFFFCTLLHAC